MKNYYFLGCIKITIDSLTNLNPEIKFPEKINARIKQFSMFNWEFKTQLIGNSKTNFNF